MKKFIILIPVYNDWQSAIKLIENIDLQLNNQVIDVILINDSSKENFHSKKLNCSKIKSIKIINLKINCGHGRAIATALKYCNENLEFDYIIPMDGDGEDRPEELKDFFYKLKNSSPDVIAGIRVKRSEGILFKLLYLAHKIFTKIITGKTVKFGNYSCLSKNAVNLLLSDGAIWSSFSGAVTRHFSSYETIKSIRGKRYFGPTKMSLIKLFLHSLRISAVFKKTVIFRVSILISLFLLITFVLSIYFIGFVLIGIFFLILIIYLSTFDNVNKLNNSLQNIKDLTNVYSR